MATDLPPTMVLADHFGYTGGVRHGVTTYLLHVLPLLAGAGVELTVRFLRAPHAAAGELHAAGIHPVFFDAGKWDPTVALRIAALARRNGIPLEALRRGGRVRATAYWPHPVKGHRALLTMLPAILRGCPRALARPVIAFAVGGLPEVVVVDGRNGRLVPAGDSEAFASTVVETLRDPARRLIECYRMTLAL